ncbi:hypothetical protein COEREDRAFT_52276, partial [Coemansia reversa NRRL 1564]
RVHDHVHSLVREIYRAIPTCGGSLATALAECWPFRTAKANMQKLFVRNSLRCLEYADSVRREVLRMVLNHIIQIDVEVQIELEDLESDNEKDSSKPTGTNNNTADSDAEQESGSDSDSDSDTASDTDSSSESDSGSDTDSVLSNAGDLSKTRNNAKKTVAKLDSLISTLLTWLERHAPTSPETDEQSEATSRLFLLFLDLFDAVVLPTFKSRYTQFVLFYLCAKDAQYADVFLGTMVGKVGEPVRSVAQDRVSRVAKVAAAAYLGSFVARAKFLHASIVRNVVSVLVQWVNTYLDWHEQQQHEAEIAARSKQMLLGKLTQAILYMFCFRWRDMAEAAGGGPVVESELDNLRWCRELDGLQRVVFSRLNPLRACAPAVAQQFASVSSQTSFMFCYAVSAGASSDQALRARLDSFFPFDPMALPVSRQFIDPIYLEWQDVGEELSDDEDDNVDYHVISDHSDIGIDIPSAADGNEDEVIEQIVVMSISPVVSRTLIPGHRSG